MYSASANPRSLLILFYIFLLSWLQVYGAGKNVKYCDNQAWVGSEMGDSVERALAA